MRRQPASVTVQACAGHVQVVGGPTAAQQRRELLRQGLQSQAACGAKRASELVLQIEQLQRKLQKLKDMRASFF